ncbi:MAG: lytic transglycosylase domain-containing protein [Povalibacter sp.]
MARSSSSRRSRSKRRWRIPRWRISRLWPSARRRKQLWRAYLRAALPAQIIVGLGVLFVGWLLINGLYQVARKPTELFFPVSGTLYKAPVETWRAYETIFRRHSTATISPEFLAALAQVEGSGNPIVRTYWRWSWSRKPFEVYRPASSAVGMYQITDGTFDEARQYCIHDHRVVADGPWDDWHSCWFNWLYLRVIPSHSVELTSAYLDTRVTIALTRAGIGRATASQKQDLAAVIHLCGAGAGLKYAARGLRLITGQRCGDHEVRVYVTRVNAMKRVFASM